MVSSTWTILKEYSIFYQICYVELCIICIPNEWAHFLISILLLFTKHILFGFCIVMDVIIWQVMLIWVKWETVKINTIIPWNLGYNVSKPKLSVLRVRSQMNVGNGNTNFVTRFSTCNILVSTYKLSRPLYYVIQN